MTMLEIQLKACQRCGGDIRIDGEEPHCFQCGWADYTASHRPQPSTGYVEEQPLTYIGTNTEWVGLTAMLRLARGTAQVRKGQSYIRAVYCPMLVPTEKHYGKPTLCGVEMDGIDSVTYAITVAGGQKRKRLLMPYRCPRGHAIGITKDWVGWA